MSKSNYVYLTDTSRITSYGMWNQTRVFKDLTSLLHWMELNDLVFLNADQVDRLKHGDSATFKSSKKTNKEHKTFVIGEVKVESYY